MLPLHYFIFILSVKVICHLSIGNQIQKCGSIRDITQHARMR